MGVMNLHGAGKGVVMTLYGQVMDEGDELMWGR